MTFTSLLFLPRPPRSPTIALCIAHVAVAAKSAPARKCHAALHELLRVVVQQRGHPIRIVIQPPPRRVHVVQRDVQVGVGKFLARDQQIRDRCVERRRVRCMNQQQQHEQQQKKKGGGEREEKKSKKKE